MKTKPLFIGLFSGLLIGSLIAYLWFISMNMAGVAGYLLALVGGSGGLVAAIAYFCRQYVEYRLGIEAEETKIRFSKTYQLRAEAISEAHGRLLDLHDATSDFSMRGLINNSPEREVAVTHINEIKNRLIDFLSRKQLYLPKATAAKIRELFQLVYGSHIRYTILKEHPAEERSAEVQKWLKANEQIPDYLAQLEDDFRKVLGFID
jgi:hypothetical protein